MRKADLKRIGKLERDLADLRLLLIARRRPGTPVGVLKNETDDPTDDAGTTVPIVQRTDSGGYEIHYNSDLSNIPLHLLLAALEETLAVDATQIRDMLRNGR